MLPKLIERQKLFVDYYLINLNATDAAIKAGYSKKNAARIGSQNLKKENIKQAIAEKQIKVASMLDITRDEILNRLMIIQAQTETTNVHASLKAIDLINKMLGFYEAIKTDITSNGKRLSNEIKINIIRPKD